MNETIDDAEVVKEWSTGPAHLYIRLKHSGSCQTPNGRHGNSGDEWIMLDYFCFLLDYWIRDR
jgi:hypothetical protein